MTGETKARVEVEKEQEARIPKRPLRVAIATLLASCFSMLQGFPEIAAFASDLEGASSSPATGLQSQSVQLHSFRTHSRLSLRIDEAVETEWKDIPGGFELWLKGIGLADLGAPVGGERAWAETRGFKNDPRIESLAFEESSRGVKIVGRWKFPKGDLAPADPSMERFDYRDKSPSQYVVDIWPKKGLTVGETKRLKRKQEREAEVKRQLEAARKRDSRKAEIARTRSELEDLARFCREPLSESKDVFIPFMPMREKVEFSRWFNAATPDAEFEYAEPKGESKDAEYARLALSLYKQGNFALVLKTIDFLDVEFPKSIHRHEMRFLRANALIKLGMIDRSREVLAELKASAGTSPAGLQAGMYSAITALEREEYLVSLEAFLWLVTRFPNHRLSWLFHMGAGEAAYALRQTERAAKEYQWIAENAKDRKIQASAAFRIGDVYLARADYEQALASYFQAVSRFPAEAKDFAPVHANRAEALYWLGQMPRAREEFERFLKLFPSHPGGWRTTFRLGEIAGRMPDPSSAARSRERFSETINRFPFSPGAILARIRVAPCGDHGGFDVASATKFFEEEAPKLKGDGQIGMDRYREYRGIAYVRTLTTLNELDRAIDVAIEELRAAPRAQARKIMAQYLRALFRKSLMAKLDAGNEFEALQFYQAKADSIPAGESKWGSAETEFEHLLKLSRAASDLGLGSLAQRISADYDRSIKGGKSRSPAEEAAFEERIQRGDARFTAARALFVSAGLDEAKKITELLSEVGEESPHSHEREIILGLLAEKVGKPASALAHALRAQILAPMAGVSSVRLRAWIASLQAKAGDPRAAIALYRELRAVGAPSASVLASGKDGAEGKGREIASKSAEKPAEKASAPRLPEIGESLGLVAAPSVADSILAEGELLAKMGKWGEAAQTYASAVESGLGGNQALYEYSRTLRRTGRSGDSLKADEAMRKLASSEQDDFWRKLARTTMGEAGGKGNGP